MELVEGGAGSRVEGGGSLRACPWNPWKVGLVVLCVCVWGGVIEGMSMEPMEGGAGSPVCVWGGGGH